MRQETLAEFNQIFPTENDSCPQFVDAVAQFTFLRKFLLVFRPQRDIDRFVQACRYLLSSVQTPGLKTCFNYTSVAANKNLTVQWIHQQKKLLIHCSNYLCLIRPEVSPEHKLMMICLNMILTFTNPHALQVPDEVRTVMLVLGRSTLKDLTAKGLFQSLQSLLKKGLCGTRPCLSRTELSAIITISTRPLVYFKCSDEYLRLYLLHILSVPAITLHLANTAPDMLTQVQKSCSIHTVFTFLSNDAHIEMIFASLGGSYGLCLMANIIHLVSSDLQSLEIDSSPFRVSIS